MGLIEQARDYLQSASKLDANENYCILSRAWLKAEDGNVDACRATLRLYESLRPNDLWGCQAVAILYARLGLLEDARRVHYNLLKTHPNQLQCHINLASLEAGQENGDIALEYLDRVLEQDSAHQEALTLKSQIILTSGASKMRSHRPCSQAVRDEKSGGFLC